MQGFSHICSRARIRAHQTFRFADHSGSLLLVEAECRIFSVIGGARNVSILHEVLTSFSPCVANTSGTARLL